MGGPSRTNLPRLLAPPGRNEPCPCGSGRKYKNCCQREAAASAMPSLGLDRAIDAFQQGSFAEVIRLTEQPAAAARPRALYLRGRAYKALGDLAAAADSYRGALRIDPQYSDALTSLGIALRAQGLLQEAAACYAKAVDLTPQAVEAWINLGNVRLDQRKLEQAQDCFERALELQPRSWLALHRLGFVRHCHQDFAGAAEYYQKALGINPAGVDCLVHLGRALEQLDYPGEAMRCYDQALAIKPGYANALYAKAGLLKARGSADEAEAVLTEAFDALPADIEQTYQLAAESFMLGRFADAATCYRRVLERQPRHALSWVGLGECQRMFGDLAASVESLQRAIELQPRMPDAYHGLGSTHLRLGRVAEAIAGFRRARELDPMFVEAHSAELLALSYLDSVTAAQIKAAHEQFYDQHFGANGGLATQGVHALPAAQRHAERRLRVGLLSPDFRRHSVAFFLEPLLEHLDRDRFEVFCYYEDTTTDEITARFKRLAQQWRQVHGEPPATTGRRIRDDEIDILIDLSGHAGRSPVVMAGRWAPVQATYLGYPTTSGMRSIDYRITDWLVDPPGYESFNVETPLRLPGSYFCYRPPALDVSAAHLPGAGEEVVFASFNNLAKVNAATLALWAAVLRAVPESRLLVKNRGLEEGDLRSAFLQRLGAAGLEPDRVDLAGWKPGLTEHFSAYRAADIALDTFPYNGATTTCEALWMGVPVVSRSTATHVSRMGLSILTAAGRSDLAVTDDEQFVATCVRLAADVAALRAGRETFRSRLRDSALCDAPAFAAGFGALLAQACSI